jgi:hypothetical protein
MYMHTRIYTPEDEDLPHLLQDSCHIHSLPKSASNEYENMAGGKLRVLAPTSFLGMCDGCRASLVLSPLENDWSDVVCQHGGQLCPTLHREGVCGARGS